MKMLIAVIKPHKLDEVQTTLAEIGVAGMTVSEVRGHGRQKGHTEIYRGAEYQVNFLPKIKLEIVCSDATTSKAVEAIQGAARSDQIGDGKIFVIDVAEAVRIRTGETGDEAI